MDLNWYGRGCFRLRGREAAVFADPLPRSAGVALGTIPADVVTLSRTEGDGAPATDALKGEFRVLDGPGSYEVSGVLFDSVAARRTDGVRNVIFAIEVDAIRVVHLGLPDGPPSREMLNELGEIDVLLLPIGNPNSYSVKTAVDVMTEIDPRLVVPMEYSPDGAGGLATAEAFLKEVGVTPQAEPQLKLTRGSIPTELTVALLDPRAG